MSDVGLLRLGAVLIAVILLAGFTCMPCWLALPYGLRVVALMLSVAALRRSRGGERR